MGLGSERNGAGVRVEWDWVPGGMGLGAGRNGAAVREEWVWGLG